MSRDYDNGISPESTLPETVAQNNLALRHQLGLFVKWRQQNEQLHQEQRHRISEISQQMSTLQQENAMLRAQLACTKVRKQICHLQIMFLYCI